MFILRFNEGGTLLASIVYNLDASQLPQGFVKSSFDNGIQDPPPESINSEGDLDGLIARMTYATEVLQQIHLGGTGRIDRIELAATGAGDVVAAVTFKGELTIPGGPTLVNEGDYDIALIGLSRTLEYQWSTVLGGLGDDVARDLVADGPGKRIAISGSFLGELAFGPNTLSAVEMNGFFAVVDAAGEPVWARGFGGPGEDRALRTRFDSSGHLYISGVFSVSADVGTGALQTTR